MQFTVWGHRGIAAAALLAALVVLGTSQSGSATATGGNPAILEPGQGALFGAWTKPRGGHTALQELASSEQQLGRQLDIYHVYYHVDKALPTADMVSAARSGHTILMAFDPDPVNSTPTWQEIWQGTQDATLIKRAQELRAFGYPVMLNFDHEADANIGPNGTPSDYVKAYQHVYNLFQSQGATNVIWVWDMRGSLFTSSAGADSMYPGDQYVDWVAADAYNWYPGKGGSNWRSFADAFAIVPSVGHGDPSGQAADGRGDGRPGRPLRSRPQGGVDHRHGVHDQELAADEGGGLVQLEPDLPVVVGLIVHFARRLHRGCP